MDESDQLSILPGPAGPPPRVSKKTFAEMRRVSAPAVSQWIGKGMPVEPNGLIEVAAADAWLKENIDPTRRRARLADEEARPGSPRSQLVTEQARIAKLKADKLEANLIDRKATLRAVEARARIERDAWIAWVNRAAPDLVAVAPGDMAAVVATLDRLVREHLETLARMPIRNLTEATS